LIKEVKEAKDEFDHDIKSKADNYTPSMENEIKQEKKRACANRKSEIRRRLNRQGALINFMSSRYLSISP
jgi:hypothetical protein